MAQQSDTLLITAKMEQLGIDKTPEEFIESLAPPIKRRVEALQEVQERKDGLESEFRRERAELEAKYDKLYAPLFEERKGIVCGTTPVPSKIEVEGEPADDINIKGIPEFWQTVLLKCDTTAEMIRDKDLDVLKYLNDISSEGLVSEEGGSIGFKLTFHFDTNPYFSNAALDKSYVMGEDDEGVLEKSEGTKINWSTGKDVTIKVMKKKPKKGSKPDAKPQMKTEKVDSFFNFFDPPQVPGEEDDIDPEAMEELQSLIEADYEVGATIREKLVSAAVSWYTGEAVDDQDYGDYFGEDEDEDEDGDGEDFDEDDDDEDEDDDAPPAGGKRKGGAGAKAGKGAGAGAVTAAQPPECKQQ
ncbi:MAG: hypothetical protein WDW38_011495 [Sanguina aurantia]